MTPREEKFWDEVSGRWLTPAQLRRHREVEETWEGRYRELREFYLKHGHSNVLRSDPNRALSSFVHAQRNRFQKGKLVILMFSSGGLLLPYQRKMLEEINFTFVLGKGFHHVVAGGVSEVFRLRMRQLLDYKRETGHIRVPKKYEANQPLAWWYHQLRPRRKRELLTQEEIDLLDEVGYEWETEKTKTAERMRAEREAAETKKPRTRSAPAPPSQREEERIRLRKELLQKQMAAKKAPVAAAKNTKSMSEKKKKLATSVLPRSRSRAAASASASSPTSSSSMSGSHRRASKTGASDTETEADEGEEDDDDDGTANGVIVEEGVTGAGAKVASACSRVDYDSDAGDEKVVVASIVWDGPPADKVEG